MQFAGTTVVILGLAREGESLARYCASQGANVTIADDAPAEQLAERVQALAGWPIRFVRGSESQEVLDGAERFFVSPGVPESHPLSRTALDRGIAIESMTTLFFDLCPGRLVGVTGSSGKTTTTGLIGHILRTAGVTAVIGGNIGKPMLELLPDIRPDTLVVLELSSFQLSLARRSPHIAVVTNISPNHLDRHGSMEEYVGAKLHLTEYQSADNHAVLNADDGAAELFAAVTPAHVHWYGCNSGLKSAAGRRGGHPSSMSGLTGTIRSGSVGLARDGEFRTVMPTAEIPLLGQHNWQNVLAAVTCTSILGVDPEDMRAGIGSFVPPPHRLQTVGRMGGVQFIDDSVATSPARAVVALHAINSPVLLIAGGRDKSLPWDEFARVCRQKVRGVFLIGEAGPLIEASIRQELRQNRGLLTEEMVFRCESLAAAVREAAARSRSGDAVLLSPGCTSYDMFRDFEERGDAFVRAIETMYAA